MLLSPFYMWELNKSEETKIDCNGNGLFKQSLWYKTWRDWSKNEWINTKISDLYETNILRWFNHKEELE